MDLLWNYMLFWKITTFTVNKFEVLLDLGVREGLGLGLKGLKWLGFGQELDYGSG